MNNTIFFFFYNNFAHQNFFLDQVVVFFADILPYFVIFFALLFLLKYYNITKVGLLEHDDEKCQSSQSPTLALYATSFANFFIILKQKWKEIILVFGSVFFAWFIAFLLKIITHIPRPFVQFQNIQPLLTETDFSFPSGHSTFFMALAFAVFFLNNKTGYIFMFFALLIGLARIMAGIHFPIDILSGFILGAGIAYMTFLFQTSNPPPCPGQGGSQTFSDV